MTNAIIFDLDGLLIDSEIIAYKIYQEILQEYGYEFSVKEYAENYSGKTEIKNVTRIIESYHLPLTLEQGIEKVEVLEKGMIAQGVALKAGEKELLAYLKANGYKTAIATSSITERAMGILKQHGIADQFDQFVFAEELTKSKPDPEVFLKACGKLSEKPEACLVLEDSEAGVQAAYAANIPVICIPDMKMPSSTHLNMTKAVLKSLNEAISYLQNV